MDSENKLPPHNQEAEQSVLGAVLIDPSAISIISEILKSRYFYFRENLLVYEGMLSLYRENQPIDILTLANELKKQKTLKDTGGKAYFSQLVDSVPTSANIEHYAKVVREAALKRQVISVGSELVRSSFSDDGDVNEMLAKAET